MKTCTVFQKRERASPGNVQLSFCSLCLPNPGLDGREDSRYFSDSGEPCLICIRKQGGLSLEEVDHGLQLICQPKPVTAG